MNRNRQFVINFTNGTLKYTFKEGQYKGEHLWLNFITAHRSKGLEADFVIIINCNSGKYGFPSGKSDDPVLNLLLSTADQFENGEERRLFYVSMTRTKLHTTFITDRYRKSKFIKELQDVEDSRSLQCPRCKNGELILRSGKINGRFFKFYGCSNFAYGCGYSKKYVPQEISEEQITEEKETLANKSEENVTATVPDKAVASSSRLTKSQRNKLDYFASHPLLYVSTPKGRSKVLELWKLLPEMSIDEKGSFIPAYKAWKEKIPK